MCNGGVVPTETSLSWKRITPPKHILSYKCSRYLEYEDIIVIFLVSTDHGAHLENVELLNYVSLGSWIFGRIFVCGCQEIFSILWKKSSFAWSWIIAYWNVGYERFTNYAWFFTNISVKCGMSKIRDCMSITSGLEKWSLLTSLVCVACHRYSATEYFLLVECH
jgi:hypothetical protein